MYLLKKKWAIVLINLKKDTFQQKTKVLCYIFGFIFMALFLWLFRHDFVFSVLEVILATSIHTHYFNNINLSNGSFTGSLN